MSSPLVDRYKALPRSAQWALWAGVLLIAYFALIEPVITLAAGLHARAADKAARLVALDKEARSGQAHQASTAAAKFGLVNPPSSEPEKAILAFNQKIAEILGKHGIRNYRHPTRTLPMSQGPLTKSISSDERAERRVAEIQFDATPESISAVLAELEKSPEIAAVSRVQVRRTDRESTSRLLHATIAAEAWVITRTKKAAAR